MWSKWTHACTCTYQIQLRYADSNKTHQAVAIDDNAESTELFSVWRAWLSIHIFIERHQLQEIYNIVK